jgi:hypothetical protein
MEYIFRSIFLNSKGKPSEYKGKVIYLHDYITIGQKEKINAKIISTKSKNKQGFCIKVIEPKNKNYISVNGIKENIFAFWEDTLPKDGANIEILSSNITIAVWNIWEEQYNNSSRRVLGAMKNAAMIIEEKNNSKIYHCNDGDQDEDFNDIVFELTIEDKL